MAIKKSLQSFECIVPIGVFIVLLLRTIAITVAPALKPAWGDEYFSFYQIDHSTWKEFCISLSTHVNATPPQYFILAWIISKFSSCSILTLRIISAFSCALAFTSTWITLRRNYSFFIANLSTCSVLLGSELFLRYSAEARFYSLYLFGVSLAVLSFDFLCKYRNVSWSILLLNTFSQFMCISFCYVGGLFSFAILVVLLLRDKVERLWRPKVYFSHVAGWIPIIFCLDSIRNSGAKVTGWIQVPDRNFIFHPFNPEIEIGNLYYVIFLISLLIFYSSFRKKEIQPEEKYLQQKSFTHLHYLAIALLAVPYVVLAVSWLGKPMMIDRYYLPAVLGIVLLTASFFEKRFSSKSGYQTIIIQVILIVCLISNPLLMAIHLKRNQPPPDRIPEFKGEGMVVIADNWPSYLPLCFSLPVSSKLYMLTREENSADAAVIKQFHSKIQILSIGRLTKQYSLILLVEYNGYGEFFWAKKELLKMGYHIVETKIQSDNGNVWTLLSNKPLN